MGRYRKIETKIWSDKKFKQLSTLQPCGQGLWLFLLTAPQTGPVPGLFHAGRASLAEELGWNKDDFDKAFSELENQGLVKADFNAKLVWLPNAIKYNLPESPNVIKSWANELEQLPECDLLFEAIETIRTSIKNIGEDVIGKALPKASPKPLPKSLGKPSPKPLGKPSPKPSGKALPKASPNQEQEQEQEQENNFPPENDRPKTSKHTGLLDREPKNDLERVNKKWLENYVALFGAEPINPSWSISSPLVSKALKQVGLEKVLQALDTAMRDKFCLDSGYILKIVMSGSVISRLVHSKTTGPPQFSLEEKQFGELSEGTVDINDLYQQFGLTGSEPEKRRKLIELRDQGVVSF
jgi:hypothetical protein